jgi:hypothetical protein
VQADLEIGIAIHDAAEHQRAERDGAVDEVADAVGQRIAGRARLDQGGPALVEEHHRAKGFHGFPERVEARVVEGDTVDVVVDRDAAVSQGGHRVLHLGDRPLDVLHGHRRQAGEPVGIMVARPTPQAISWVSAGSSLVRRSRC